MSQELEGTLTNTANLVGTFGSEGGGGTSNYNDLINKPSINSVTLQGNKTASQLGFAEVATSGNYNDLSNKPTIPAAQVNSDWNATSGVSEILNKPTVYQNASALPISANDSTDTKTYIDGVATPQSISGVTFNSTNINSGSFTCYKIGRLVMLDIASLQTKIAIGSNEEELLSGLPLPLVDTGRYSLFDGDGTARARVKVTTDGKLRMWHNPSNFTVGTGFYGNVYYISAT